MKVSDCIVRDMQPSLVVDYLTKIASSLRIEISDNYYVSIQANNPNPRKKDEKLQDDTYNLEAKIYDVSLSVQDLSLDQLKLRIDTLAAFNIGVDGDAEDPQELSSVETPATVPNPNVKYRSTVTTTTKR